MPTLWWHETGPSVGYEDGFLVIRDLNPEVQLQWRMSKHELIVLANAIHKQARGMQ